MKPNRILWQWILQVLLVAASLVLVAALGNIVSREILIPLTQEIVPEILRAYGVGGDNVRIAGTGSMYPTFPKGTSGSDVARAREIVAWSSMRRYPGGILIFGKRYGGYTLRRGDIVSFSNNRTRELSIRQYGAEAGFVKRVIGLSGDKILIKSGFVYLNGKQLKETYTARPQSTFGGTQISDCQEVLVPDGFVFVLGDNRVASTDSRDALGFVALNEIDHVLPFDQQKPYSKKWRDARYDDELVSQPTLDGRLYVNLLNQKRIEAGLKELKWNDKLAKSSRLRGEKMLASGDFSFEATKSGYPMTRAMADAGYINVTWGEAPTLGYYTAEELIENSFRFPETKKFLLEKDFQDVGVATVIGELNGCPAQVVVQHFGGYVPPNYSQAIIENWRKARDSLREVRPSWERLRTYPTFYDANKREVDRMIEILDIRYRNIEAIVARMEKNQWLSQEEKAYVERDSALAKEQDELASKINTKAQQ